MISLFIMPKRRTFGHFLTSLEDEVFFAKKADNMSSKRRTYAKPGIGLSLVRSKQSGSFVALHEWVILDADGLL